MSGSSALGVMMVLVRSRRSRLLAFAFALFAIAGFSAIGLRGDLVFHGVAANAFSGGDVLLASMGQVGLTPISIWGAVALCVLASTLVRTRGGNGSFDVAIVALSGGRARWWGAEALACVLTVAAGCAVFPLGALLWAFVLGGRVGLGADCATYSLWGGSPTLPASYPWMRVVGFLGVLFVGLVALSLLQLALSPAVGAVPAFILSVAHLATAWALKDGSLPIARLLAFRSSLFLGGQLGPEVGVAIFALVGLVAYLGGLALVSRIDIGVGGRR